MLMLLLVASAGTFFGVRHLVDQVRGTAHRLDQQTSVVTALRQGMVDHEQVAHQLLSGKPIDRAAFVVVQDGISRKFAAAVGVFPASDGTRATLIGSERSWQEGLAAAGLWGNEVSAYRGVHLQENPVFGAASDDSREMLDSLQQPSLAAMRHGLADDAGVERLLLGALAGLFGLALVVMLYFRRRMTRDMVRPVAGLHAGVLKLQAGEFDHRILVSRRDELGELAEAFNDMALALHNSHLALTHRATHDSLTGLPNRAALVERLASCFGPHDDRRAARASVLFIDIDDFKDVNDTLGHEGGDALLVQLAVRLNECVRPHDLVARLGGDEFAIAIIDGDSAATSVEVAERIMTALQTPFVVSGDRLRVAVSIGVAHALPQTADAAELLGQADFAMYMAKGGGKGRYQLFNAEMHHNMVGRTALKADLGKSEALDQLRLDYQPVVELHTGRIVGVEALVRWQHPRFGMLPPAAFIDLAEETGDIDAIGCWVLDTALRQVAGWRRLPHCADLWVSVNLSAFQLPSAHSRAALEAILSDPDVHAENAVLEVTETALVGDIDGGIASLNSFKRYGVKIAIDDFGTGFSSLSTLASLPVDILKIDRSFVSGDAAVMPSVPMLKGILGLAQTLSLNVIAEGIETPEQLNLLQTLGFRTGQGFLLARPVAADAVETLLLSGARVQLPAGVAVATSAVDRDVADPRSAPAVTTRVDPTAAAAAS